ncbi:MAG: heme exporter protein CcmB [Lautropia sp.]|nr:heme exporter protein CcmB [Lautropia sp.]
MNERQAPRAPASFIWALRRDLQVGWRRQADTLNLLGFFVLACLMFPFAVGPDTNSLSRLGPGVIWVMALLAQLSALPMLFTHDHRDGSLEQMMASGRSATALVAGKLLAVWLLSTLPLILITPMLALALSVDPGRAAVLMLTLALGTPSLLILGALGAALTLNVRAGGALLALLCLPLYIPVLIFGAGAVDMYSAGMAWEAHLALLAALALLCLWGGPYLIALALRTALE